MNRSNEIFNGYGNKNNLNETEIEDAIDRVYSIKGEHFMVSSPGKIILFGDHGDVYGRSALGTSINKRTYLRFVENKINQQCVIKMSDVDFIYECKFDKFVELVNKDIPGYEPGLLSSPIDFPSNIHNIKFIEVLNKNFECIFEPLNCNREQLLSFFVFLYLLHSIFYKQIPLNDSNLKPQQFFPMIININSELTPGSGIGSSASFCVCIAAALLYYRNIKLHGISKAEEITFCEKGLQLISKFALNCENIIHGCTSGIDCAISTYGSFIEVKHINSNRTFIEIPEIPKMNALLIDSGINRLTIDVLNTVRQHHKGNPAPASYIMKVINDVCEKGSELFKTLVENKETDRTSMLPWFQQLGILLDVNQGLLNSLGTSNESIQKICSIVSNFSMHSKQTGTGGGGCVFALFPDNTDRIMENCKKKLESDGFKVCEIELGHDGVRLENLLNFR